MEGRVERNVANNRLIVCKMDLFVFENGNTHHELVFHELTQFARRLVLPFMVRNHVNQSVFLFFYLFEVSDVGAVTHAAHHHAFQSAQTR